VFLPFFFFSFLHFFKKLYQCPALPTGGYNLAAYIRLPTPLKFTNYLKNVKKERKKRGEGEENAAT
jgi:hypothetical protein